MLLITNFIIIKVLLVNLNNVAGLCPHAHRYLSNYEFYNDDARAIHENYSPPMSARYNDDDVQIIDESYMSAISTHDVLLPGGDDSPSGPAIYEDYMSTISYDTYETQCHRFFPQPPPISVGIIEHAFNASIDRTRRYISLDIKAAAGVSAPKFLTDMDRNNYFFESATKYVQETTCSSKSTTTVYLPSFQLEKIDISIDQNETKITCDSDHIEYPSCSSENVHRPVDGTCNNLERPLDGSVGDCMLRLSPPDYKDGISQLRTSVDGSPLPNARILSTNLFGQDEERPWSTRFTQFHSFFGEFVIGDNGMTLNHATGMLINLQCCDTDNQTRVDHPHCAPICIPPEDTFNQLYPNQKCMQFARSIPCARCNLGPRMLSSSVTAAQDLNSVYGASTSMLSARRTMKGGYLKSQIVNGHELFAVERFNGSVRYRCFKGKCELSPLDVRSLLTPTALAFALLFHKNHNRHARILATIKPKWSDEQLFQEARRWNIAEYQHCVYNEYLETLIGAELTDFYGILPRPVGQFSNYESDVYIKTVIEFQSTAGRQGHAALNEDISIIEPKSGREIKINFRDTELMESIFYDGLVDGMFLVQMSKPAFETTPSVPFKTFLQNSPGLDLAALDIHRQRDHGIAGYIYYLKHCHSVEVNNWEDLQQFIDLENIEKLKEHYKYVEDVELYVGGHYERKLADAVVGPTFASIIGIQFYNVKYGDRFFYEHGDQLGSFSIEQLNEIKTKTSFASLLCKNTDLDEVLVDPFRLTSYTNQFVSCSVFDDIDYCL